MNDLTCIFLTVNKVPKEWAEYHKRVTLEAIGDTPVISVSKEPLDWGINIIQDETPSISCIYKQILRASKMASTAFIAVIEDDTLYHKSHFSHRPKGDVTYNFHRWGLFTWGTPTFYYKDRISNACMIARRESLIKTLEERFEKYPENRIGEVGKEKGTTINRLDVEHYWSDVGTVYLSHVNSLDPTEQHKSKKMGSVKAYEIPYWGRAEDIRKEWK